jgi:LmbE family N-acetylglucosaminyl deacetylase
MKWRLPRGRVLALAAHPDDESIGCGGAIALHRRRGDRVKVVVVTDGEAGGPGRLRGGERLRAIRRAESRAAARALGVHELEFWGFPDGGLRGRRGLANALEAELARYRPRVVYRPAADDPHPDHAALGRAFERAARLSGVPFDCRYEVWSAPRPTAVLDIGDVVDVKGAALRAYQSQEPRPGPSAMSAKLNAARGLLVGALWGEGFRVRRREAARPEPGAAAAGRPPG